ncbi:MAG: TetR/AcrR family transcriptional regulator [Polyangiaceae bacterium]|nr:TetR/AcrR family transcriptional regulator [Polyangiaceae bacterium]
MGDARRATEVRQVELTDAALHIIATRGITALTTRSLAEHVGLTSGAIFRHFASLDALLEAVVMRVEAVLEATYPPATLSPVEKLDRFIEARTAAVGNQIGILRLVLSEQFLLALPKSGSERLSACVERTRAFIVQCLRDGQKAGEVRVDLSAETLAPIVMGTMQMLALSAANTQQRTQARVVRDTLHVLLRPTTTSTTTKTRKRSA